jgi:broad specificity phosphatase PhoE
MRLYLIRHGDPDYEKDVLTPAGILEAKALAKRLEKEGIDEIYYSPLGRARETMSYTAQLTGIKPELLEWTEEIYYYLEVENWGRTHVFNIPGEVVRSIKQGEYYDNWFQRAPYNDPGLLKLLENINEQSDLFFARHGYKKEGNLYRIEKQNSKKIAVFAHAALGLAWLSHLLAIPTNIMWSSFWPATSSVSTILFEERSPTWAVPRCLGLGDVSHLYAENLPVNPVGLPANFY